MTFEVIPLSRPEIDRINRRTYRSRAARRQFAAAAGWLEPGEQAAIEFAAPQARGGAILDIGIGGGRTAPLMASISLDYRGIDYCDTMVAAARERFPEFCFHEMDARRMIFDGDTFHLVSFSYNGIDSVDLAGRQAILHQVHRVLRVGGRFVFSTLNRDGAAYQEHWPDLRTFGTAASPMQFLRCAGRLALGGVNRLRARAAEKPGTELAIGALSAHNFGLVVVFISVGAQVRQLQEHGFAVVALFDPAGRRTAFDGSEATSAPWYHFVAEKLPLSPG